MNASEFSQFLLPFVPDLYRAAHGLGLPAEDADDLVRATIADAIEGRCRLGNPARCRTWLLKALLGLHRRQRSGTERDR